MTVLELVDPRGRRWTVDVAETTRDRVRGLRGRAELPPGHAFLIREATSIHTFGMRFPILAVWLDSELVVTAVKRLPPRRITLPRFHARHVLECAEDADVRVGDRLRIAGTARG